MRKRLPTRNCLGEFHPFEDFSFRIPQASGERGSFPIPLGICVLFLFLWGAEKTAVGRPPASMGVRLAFDAGEVWHLAGEKSGAEVLSHHRGSPRWRPFMSKDPPLLQTHSPHVPSITNPAGKDAFPANWKNQVLSTSDHC